MSRWTQKVFPQRSREWWRERRSWELSVEGHSNARKLQALVEARAAAGTLTDEARLLLETARAELRSAVEILSFEHHRRTPSGSHVTAAQIHLNAAQLLWVKSFLASPDDISPYLPSLQTVVREHLPKSDPRRSSVDRLQHVTADNDLIKLTEAVDAAQSAALREKLRAGGFVRIVWLVSAFLLLLAAGVAVAGAVWPTAVPLCFNPARGMATTAAGTQLPRPSSPVDYAVVCPTGSDSAPASRDLDQNFAAVAAPGDYLVVELVGLVAAGVASAAVLRKINGSSTPYSVPVALAALKLPAGALTAVLGLLLMRGGFVPGLTALDNSAQIVAWALVFGYSQELFTKFVDRRGQSVLEGVRGSAGPPPTAPATGATGPHPAPAPAALPDDG
jgi:hypothetical protein